MGDIDHRFIGIGDNHRLSFACYLLVMLVGVIALCGAIFNWRALDSLVIGLVNTKRITAASAIACAYGGGGLFIGKNKAVAFGTALGLVIAQAVAVGVLVAGGGLQEAAKELPPDTVAPGVPSLGTIGCFAYWAGLLFWGSHGHRVTPRSGWILVAAGASTCVGHWLGLPILYFYLAGISTGMALPTALMVGLLGLALIFKGA